MPAQRFWAMSGAELFMATADLINGGSGVSAIPVPTFLVQHDKDLVLIDTGLDPLAAGGLEDDVYGFVHDVAVARYPQENSVVQQLRRIGKRPSEVTDIVLTHAHFDHTGGLYAFRNARIHLQRPEWEFVQEHLHDDDDVHRFTDFRRVDESQVVVHEGDTDLFGDGSIRIVALPGHTPGNIGVIVALPDRRIFFTGDTVHLRAALRREVAMPLDWNQDTAVKSIQRLRAIAKDEGLSTWITHDPSDWEDWAAPGEYC